MLQPDLYRKTYPLLTAAKGTERVIYLPDGGIYQNIKNHLDKCWFRLR